MYTYFSFRHFLNRHLHRLVLFQCQVNDIDLSYISNWCNNLRSLSLVDCSSFTNEGISIPFLNNTSSLIVLYLSFLQNTTSLRELKISRFDEERSGPSIANPQVHQLTSLTDLIIVGEGRGIRDKFQTLQILTQADIGIILQNLSNLQSIYYEDTRGDMEGWQNLTRLSSLCHLGIALRSQIDMPQISSLFPTIGSMKQLKTIFFNPLFFSNERYTISCFALTNLFQ